MKLTVVTEETRPGRWTATASGYEDTPGSGLTEEAALADLRTAVAASRHWAGSGYERA